MNVGQQLQTKLTKGPRPFNLTSGSSASCCAGLHTPSACMMDAWSASTDVREAKLLRMLRLLLLPEVKLEAFSLQSTSLPTLDYVNNDQSSMAHTDSVCTRPGCERVSIRKVASRASTDWTHERFLTFVTDFLNNHVLNRKRLTQSPTVETYAVSS